MSRHTFKIMIERTLSDGLWKRELRVTRQEQLCGSVVGPDLGPGSEVEETGLQG